MIEMLVKLVKDTLHIEAQTVSCFISRFFFFARLGHETSKTDMKIFSVSHRKLCTYKHTNLYVNTAPEDVS